MKITTKDEINAVCPHCSKELTEIFRKKETLAGPLIQPISVYICPNCLKVLSITTWYSW
ncbi:MAG: hypothetical protein PHW54_04440 [Candidatus Omnitrophica bacterium]|nr:hypothetical protein [Candidatus Omnitrophota bacterium]